ncbi:MAG TPA: CHASE domain-containing protein, partial [Acidimicrobiia bacterium]|nr:CHASE domain-containing protein [Acidimicrobiia bacterium]
RRRSRFKDVVERIRYSRGPESLGGLLASPGRRLISLVALVGVVLSLAGSIWLWTLAASDADAALAARTQVVVDSTTSALSDANLRLVSVAGLYQASTEVQEIEFRRFVRKLGQSPGMEAIGVMPLVMGRNRDEYESARRQLEPDFAMFDVDGSGERHASAERRVHIPLQWYEPIESFDHIEGFDSMSDPTRAEALEGARMSRGAAISPFLNLVSQNESDGFVIYWPITDAETEALTGYATAAMDLSLLMDGAVPTSYDSLLDWGVIDITNQSPKMVLPGPGVERIAIGGRTWEFVISPLPGTDMTANPRSSLLLLITGLAGTALVVVVLESRRRHRVAREQFEKLRELTSAKDQFLASVGHELRTPLTSVLGFAEILRNDEGELSNEDRIGMVATVAAEASDLAAIVDDLLVAARSELDLLVVTKVSVSARAQVAQVLEMKGKDACDRIDVSGEAGNPYRALGDPARVRQILRNMITNADRYGGEKVQIRLGSNDSWVTVQVVDNGEGVPQTERDQIFSPYYRAHSSSSQPAALGIGLSVARQLARLMNGDLVYRRVDHWTVFELSLPRIDTDEVPVHASAVSLTSIST